MPLKPEPVHAAAGASATDAKPADGAKPAAKKGAAAAPKEPDVVDVSRLDIRVGKIVA